MSDSLGDNTLVTVEPSPQAAELIQAKMLVPALPAAVVARPRLVDQLVGFAKPLVLVCAPAGYGKSTLLQQWAQAEERRVAWVSLDPSESDPVLFWRYVTASIGEFEPEVADEVHGQLSGSAPNLTGVVIPRLLNALARTRDPIVVILDDYHRVEPTALRNSLSVFLRHVPRSVTIGLASRTPPALALAEMHARGLVLEIGESDLRLTKEEAVAAVARFSPDAPVDTVDRIYRSTEGWAAGLYLSSATRRADNAHRQVHDYIVTEMLDALDEDDRAFMRKTSILGELRPAPCDHVSNSDHSARRIARLGASNLLMVRLDEQGARYRYHHLLQDALQAELAQTATTEDLRALHLRAFDWYADAGNVSQAIHHAIQAGAIAGAVALVCGHWYDYMIRGRVATVQRWISWFSESDLLAHPPILPTGANAHGFGGNVAEAQRFARLADASSYEGDPLDGSASFVSSVSIMHAALVLDGPANALVHAARAAELEPPNSSYRPAIAAMLGAYRFMTGAASGYYPLLVEGARAASGPPETAAYALANLALIHAWRNEWDQAEQYAHEVVVQADEDLAQRLSWYGLAYAVAARAALVAGDTVQGERLLAVALGSEQQAHDSTPFDSAVQRTATAEALLELGRHGVAENLAHRALRNVASMGEAGIVERRLDRIVREVNAAAAGARERDRKAPAIGSLLSTRELQVLNLLATDLTLAEIASQLYLSVNTVKAYTKRTYRKLDVHSRQQAVAAGRALGYL